MCTNGRDIGYILSQVDFKSFAQACTHLAKCASTKRDFLDKHKDIIDRVKFSEDPIPGNICFQAFADKYNKRAGNVKQIIYNIFANDSLFAENMISTRPE